MPLISGFLQRLIANFVNSQLFVANVLDVEMSFVLHRLYQNVVISSIYTAKGVPISMTFYFIRG